MPVRAGTGRVDLSSISRRISTSPTRLSSDLTRSANSRWAGQIRSGHILRHILNGTGPATNPGGWIRRASCQLARSSPRFRSPMKHGTRGQAGSLSYGTSGAGDRHIRSRDRREMRVAVKTCPPGRTWRNKRGFLLVVGIRFHIGGERIPGSLGALFPARPLGGMGHETGTGSSGTSGRRWPIACRRSRWAHPRRCARWDKWTRRDNKKWSRRDGTLTFNIRGAPESGPTARWGVGLRSVACLCRETVREFRAKIWLGCHG